MGIGRCTLESLGLNELTSDALSKSFWAGKRVVLTGHTGFKGSWLLIWLQSLGAEVLGMSLPAEDPSMFRLLELEALCRHQEIDIGLERAKVRELLIEFNPEIIVHLAAQPFVHTSYEDPVGTYQTNVMGTMHLLSCCRELPQLRSVVVVTTDKCYENLEQQRPFTESDRLGGYDPYSSSKACTEILTQSMRSSYFNPTRYGQTHHVTITTARAGNVIGGGDFGVYRILPDAVRAIEAGKALEVRNPRAVRPWQHVIDPVHGYILLACVGFKSNEVSGAWNFGPDESNHKTVNDLIDQFYHSFPNSEGWRDMDQHGFRHEANFLILNSEKAKVGLGWRPRYSFKEAVETTAEWYELLLEGGKSSALVQKVKDQLAHVHGVGEACL